MEALKYFKHNELEFLSLYHHFKHMIEEGTIRDDDNAKQFIEVLESMKNSLNDIAQLRRETIELEQGQARKVREVTGNCPVCLDVVPVIIRGEILNEAGYLVNELECQSCGTQFDDYLPTREDDLMRWYENFLSKLSVSHEDGPFIDHSLIPSEEMNSIRELYEDLKKNREAVRVSKHQLEQIEKTSDKQMKEVTQYLYMIYGQTISGENQSELN